MGLVSMELALRSEGGIGPWTFTPDVQVDDVMAGAMDAWLKGSHKICFQKNEKLVP